MNIGKVAKMLGQAAAYGFGVGAAISGVSKLAGYVANKVKNRKCTYYKGYENGFDDGKAAMSMRIDELEKQLKENNELLKKAIRVSEAAE